MSSSQILRQVNLKVDMVPRGRHGRKVVRPMTPRYITIHSTQNYSADAYKHSQALKNGALSCAKTRHGNRIGYLIWHFTVDDHVAIQHMPTNEQGEHADFNGPGNRLSIGIEMCEQRGSNIGVTMERTAKLTAVLMKRNRIPLRTIVPHYHWPRAGRHPPNKNCPHFLMDNGRPGAKWRRFLGRVNYYYGMLE
ncbi:MAG: N-acetylmuramoyl-L-alanine amidase [Gloeobacteraceae cyanobacterium ES-bin-144]|nr:N-acetylmuramoyl-L-alanine amidase [Verrucomicrobiales bacterium]